MKITFFEENDTVLTREAEDAIRKALVQAARHSGLDFCVNIQLTDNAGIRQLNRDFRGLDCATDVLSFPAYEFEGLLQNVWDRLDVEMEADCLFIGDISISVECALEQADEFGHSPEREMAFLALHGTLHLLGYDHELETDEMEMVEIQRVLLEQAGIGR